MTALEPPTTGETWRRIEDLARATTNLEDKSELAAIHRSQMTERLAALDKRLSIMEKGMWGGMSLIMAALLAEWVSVLMH